MYPVSSSLQYERADSRPVSVSHPPSHDLVQYPRRPVVEELPLTPEGAAAAIKKVHDNTVRFRVVLTAEGASKM